MQKLIQLVHIGKSQLKMSEESYRLLLEQLFGKRSSKALNEQELRQLINILQQKGATLRLPFGRVGLSQISKKLWATWKAMESQKIVENGSSHALNAYVASLFPDKAWNKLNAAETAQVIESLKQWQKRVGG
ncbi:phage protein GemA/Gp16 family protein [Frederiksenia canicola]